MRETLFNWLAPRLPGARCLDLFAGSGALGLESLSRGAAHVTFVERDAAAVRELRARLSEWRATGGQVESGDALRFLEARARSGPGAGSEVVPPPPGSFGFESMRADGGTFDIVFLDPPFDSNLLGDVARSLEEGQWLSPGALIYIECAARQGLPALPPGWTVTKAKEAGEVGYHLLTRSLEGREGE